MKISTKNAIYVQKQDLEFLKYRLRSLPSSINDKIFENVELDPDDFDKYDFFKFEEEEDIEFFKSLDWLIDYTAVKDLGIEELKYIGENLVKKFEEVACFLYSIDEKSDDYKKTILDYTVLQYQNATLSDIFDLKNGLLKIKLPNTRIHLPRLVRDFFSRISK